MALLAARPLAFPPGERWAYTNAFPILGLVVERVTGQSYAEFVRKRIFTPLGLTSARFKMPGDVVPHRADGYLWKDGAYRHGETLRPQVVAANGGVLMNVLDFAAWDVALTSGRLLKPATVIEMATPARLNDGTTVGHGLDGSSIPSTATASAPIGAPPSQDTRPSSAATTKASR